MKKAFVKYVQVARKRGTPKHRMPVSILNYYFFFSPRPIFTVSFSFIHPARPFFFSSLTLAGPSVMRPTGLLHGAFVIGLGSGPGSYSYTSSVEMKMTEISPHGRRDVCATTASLLSLRSRKNQRLSVFSKKKKLSGKFSCITRRVK